MQVLLCCRNGVRREATRRFLEKQGFDVTPVLSADIPLVQHDATAAYVPLNESDYWEVFVKNQLCGHHMAIAWFGTE